MHTVARIAGLTAALLLGTASQLTTAGTITCPETMGGAVSRQFSLTTATGDPACVAYGNQDYSSDSGFAAAISGLTAISGSPATPTGDGAVSGTWAFSSSLYDDFSQIYIVLQADNRTFNPDWALFSLPSNLSSGTWALVNNGAQDRPLITSALFGRTRVAVPEPAVLALLGLGLAGLGLVRRRTS